MPAIRAYRLQKMQLHTFHSDFCHRYCLQDGRPMTVKGLSKEGEQALQQSSFAQAHITSPSLERIAIYGQYTEQKEHGDYTAAHDALLPQANKEQPPSLHRKRSQCPVVSKQQKENTWSTSQNSWGYSIGCLIRDKSRRPRSFSNGNLAWKNKRVQKSWIVRRTCWRQILEI
jgi:hypothetical protein